MTRRCVEPGCITLLSGYNPEDKCWAHQEPDKTSSFSPWIGPTYRVCPDCGGFMGKQGCKLCRANAREQTVASVPALDFRSVEAS